MHLRQTPVLIVGILSFVLLCGCGYMRMVGHEFQRAFSKIDIQSPFPSQPRVSDPSGVLMGRITGSAPAGKPIAVVAFLKYHEPKQRSHTLQLVDYNLLPAPAPYTLYVPEGNYQVMVFVDANQNFILEKDELAGHYGGPNTVVLKSEEVVADLDIELNGSTATWLDFPISLQKLPHRKMGEYAIEAGGSVDLENDGFAKKYGSMGLWQPDAFINTIGIHLYSLEPCDPRKIPVLFMHGIGGTPRDFTYLAKSLDRRYFQPWFYYYPTGIRLSLAAELLHEKIEDLYDIYQFENLYVVAHSMGGLVARAFVNYQIQDNDAAYIPLLISISTPWAGDRTARIGVETSPVSADSWQDIAAGSQFIGSLFKTPLPNHFKFYLFYSYGGNKRLHWDANDGTVTLKSQLDPRAKADAFREIGFNQNHLGILFSSETTARLNEILTATRTEKDKAMTAFLTGIAANSEGPPQSAPVAGPSTGTAAASDRGDPSASNGIECRFVSMLQSVDSTKKREAARYVARKQLKDPEIFEAAESELIRGYRINLSDAHHVDAMAWMCNLLGASGQARYKATLARVGRECQNRKIQRYAQRNLRKLP